MIVIIPSRREINLSYLMPLIDYGARFIIIDDTEGTITLNHPQFRVFNWNDKKRIAGDWLQAFPGGNGACMSFGFYVAWRESGDDEIILTLGDDCRIDEPDFPVRVEAALTAGERPRLSSQAWFVNTLDMIEDLPPCLFTRGFPYDARPGYAPVKLDGVCTEPPSFNLGLWRNVLDINAVDKLGGLNFAYPNLKLKHQSVALPPRVLASISSGNMQFRRRLIPAVYQLPMNFAVTAEWVIDRFGDIWGGFVLKLLMDKAGDTLTIGEPLVFHVLPGYVTQNIVKEHICNLVNREFIDLLSDSMDAVRTGPYSDMIDQLRDAFSSRLHNCSPLLRPYILHLCGAWRAWTSALR